MKPTCATRMLKNARFLLSREVSFLSETEPLDGYPSIIPIEILATLERVHPKDIRDDRLSDALFKTRPPTTRTTVSSPLFSGTLKFIQTKFTSGGKNFAIPVPDQDVAIRYSVLASVPLSGYASQYGPNKLAVDTVPIPFNAPVTGAKYNDSILSGWVDQIAAARGFGADTCLVFLNPSGVVNTDADPAQGVMGYHNKSTSGVPYAFVNVLGTGLTVDDKHDVYALALSHEIVEMTCDPRADGSNPETSDSCSGNCGVNFRNYFDASGSWLSSTPTSGNAFFTAGVAKPSAVNRCPAPPGSCSYPPPSGF